MVEDEIINQKCQHDGYEYTKYTVTCMSTMLDDMESLVHNLIFPHVIEFHYPQCNSTYCTLFNNERDFGYFLSGIKAIYMGYRL